MNNLPLVKIALCFFETPDERVLILKRNPLVYQGNKWGLAGGKIEKNEKPLCAVQREVMEEVNVRVPKKDFKYIGKCDAQHNNMLAECYVYKVFVFDIFKPKLRQEEAIDFKWASYKDIYNMDNMMRGLREVLDYVLISPSQHD